MPFLGDIVLGLMPKATEKGLQVSYKPDPDLAQHDTEQSERGGRVISQVLYINVDNDHLREVLANLVENAIKYTLAGSVTIDAQGDDQHVTISISDSGIGIPKEDIPHLFQKFYRVDNTETREIGGTGLGLYLSRKLTEAMGGKIWAESTYQQGSTFYVRFPRVDHVEAKRLIEQPTVQTTTPQNQPQPQVIPQPTSQAAPQIQTISATPIPQPVTQTIPVQAAPPQATPLPPVRPPLNPNGSERPSVESMGPPPRPNYAPRFTPNTRPNTPLSTIEQNPHHYVQSSQTPASPSNPNQSQ